MQHGFQETLPEPDAASAAHGERVQAYIAQQIDRAGGVISFAEFMHHALYSPGLGYYSAGAAKFGKDGDFVTAPEVSPLFGRVLARQCAPVLRQSRTASLLELGAGSGRLAVDLLGRLKDLDALPDRYLILEVSADLRQRQQERLHAEMPEVADRVAWVADWPRRFRGVVVANEVIDALPVERFALRGDDTMQLCVSRDRGGFTVCERPAPDFLLRAVAGIAESIDGGLPSGYVSEVCCALGGWIDKLAAGLDEGLVFLCDYGVSRREYYAGDRSGGWLRCHFRHRAHNNPLVLAGIQDITAWVDFTAVAEAAVAAGLDILGFTSQAQFLIAGGLQDELALVAKLGDDAQLAMAREVKLLTLPGEMGEHFKCLALGRGSVSPPSAFGLADRTASL